MYSQQENENQIKKECAWGFSLEIFDSTMFLGLGAADLLRGIMELFPLDQYVEKPVSDRSL